MSIAKVMDELLTEVVAFHICSPIVKHLPTLEEKARKIESRCFDGGGIDTCNLISYYDDLYTAILEHLQHLSANNTTQHKGNNDADL